QSIAFYSYEESTIKKVAVGGGGVLTICKIEQQPSGMNLHGDEIIFAQNKGIMRVSANGGEPELLLANKPSEVATSPQLLDGGRAILFSLVTSTGRDLWDKAQVVVQQLPSGERRTLVRAGGAARYVKTGHLVYSLAGTLFAVP